MMSAETARMLRSFPGFKFSPTDEELILFYLKKKVEGSDDDRSLNAIVELNITDYEPWDLPGKSKIQISNNEWYFFSPRDPEGMQSKRITATGYWRPWGKAINVKSGSRVIGTKRTLVFHRGRARKGERTEWILHEFCLNGTPKDPFVICRLSIHGEPNLNGIPGPSLTSNSSTHPLETLNTADKDEGKSGTKRKNEELYTFDFNNPPEEVSWALVDEDEGLWEPSIDNERVPETSAQEWSAVFNCISEMN